MVPTPKPTEYLYELRAVAENISSSRSDQWEVHPPKAVQLEADVRGGEDEVSNANNSDNVDIVGRPTAAEVAQPLLEPECGQNAQKSPSADPVVNVGPAWQIPMTQEGSLQDLPSQLDLDWQDSITPTPSLAATRNLGEELDAVVSSQVIETAVVMPVDAFVEVSQIAKEAVTDATCSRPERV